MSSLRYRAVIGLLRLKKYRQRLSARGEEREAFLREIVKHQKNVIPLDELRKTLDVRQTRIGAGECVILKSRGHDSGRKILYLYGGGFLRPIEKADWSFAAEIAERTGDEVWVLLYPLFPRHVMHETVESAYEAYRRMLEETDAGKIRFLGFSSGASLSAFVCLYLRTEHPGMPLPAELILNSPVLQLPLQEEQKKLMAELDAKDPVLPAVFFSGEGLCASMIEAEDEESLYVADVPQSDLSGFPPVYLTYGSEECPAAFVPSMKRACEAYHVPLRVKRGEGMMHCWGLRDIYPEGRAFREEMITHLNEE